MTSCDYTFPLPILRIVVLLLIKPVVMVFRSWPLWRALVTLFVYHSTSFGFINCLKQPLTVKPNGWNICVMFPGTLLSRMLCSSNFVKPGLLICPLKTSMISSAGWLGLHSFSFSFVTYGTAISWIILKPSFSLPQCFSLKLMKKDSRIFTHGRHLVVLLL